LVAECTSGTISRAQQICVQEINKETVLQLEAALAAEKSARADLTAKLNAAALANQEARDRRRALEDQITSLETQMENQRETDPNYKEWSDTPLPDGVADRMRDAASTNNPSPLRDSED
jgi:chromosome segregation ATPase